MAKCEDKIIGFQWLIRTKIKIVQDILSYNWKKLYKGAMKILCKKSGQNVIVEKEVPGVKKLRINIRTCCEKKAQGVVQKTVLLYNIGINARLHPNKVLKTAKVGKCIKRIRVKG